MNNAYVGNYGVKEDEVESSSVKIRGLICKNISDRYSRMLANDNIGNYLQSNNIVAIHGVDTRALVQHIRSKGAMNCIISTEITDVEALKSEVTKIPDMSGLEFSAEVSTKEAYTVGDAGATYRIAVLDFGVKRSMLQYLSQRDAYLKVFPAHTPFSELKEFSPDGYFISNGPGDPAAMDFAVNTVKEILEEKLPMFGICLGQQLLARSQGIPTFKMHHGHRGINHPVKNLLTGKCEITTQNHGFSIDSEVAKNNPNIEVTHINLNDNSVEGIRLKDRPAFSVQYHPESTPGPHDSRYLFDEFLKMIAINK
jgi:carbamoyl-phosphate synthase small subunit